ncbi:MAG: hypothetical protein WA687_07400, partial [Solirubrobacterales bacterium]
NKAAIAVPGVKNIAVVNRPPLSRPKTRISAHSATGIAAPQIGQQRRAPVLSSSSAIGVDPQVEWRRATVKPS